MSWSQTACCGCTRACDITVLPKSASKGPSCSPNALRDQNEPLVLRWTKALKRYAEKSTVAGARIYGSGVPPPKEIEPLNIAFDASFTHM